MHGQQNKKLVLDVGIYGRVILKLTLQTGFHLRVRTGIKWHNHRIFKQWNVVPSFFRWKYDDASVTLTYFCVTVVVTLTR